MFKKALSSKRGEMYIEAIVTVIIIMALLLFCLSALQVASKKNQADNIADALLECATYRGCFDAEFYALAEDLQEKYPGLPFTVEVSGDWYNSTYQRVQLGDEMSVTVRFTVTINGFGSFLKITLPATRTGASENYWKTDS